jgi:hypothetical protein
MGKYLICNSHIYFLDIFHKEEKLSVQSFIHIFLSVKSDKFIELTFISLLSFRNKMPSFISLLP